MSSVMIERVATPPEHCPSCNRKNGGDTVITGGWHPYIHIPDAPAVGCGACGYVVYVEGAFLGEVRRELKAKYPKAAAGKITKRFNRKRRS